MHAHKTSAIMGGAVRSRPSTPSKEEDKANLRYFLRAKHVELLQKSWPAVDEFGCTELGAMMFCGLYERCPETFTMFAGFCYDPNWRTSSHFKHHCRVVVAVIGSMIKTLKTPQILCPHLEFLGFQHKLRDIELHHFSVLGEEMIKALEIALSPGGKDAWNADVKEAWTDLYNSMRKIIQQNMDLDGDEAAAASKWVATDKHGTTAPPGTGTGTKDAAAQQADAQAALQQQQSNA